MGFLLRENSYLLKCYPTIKVFCGLAVKQRGPEVEITGFSFWLRHKFPLSELWARAFITACVTLAVPLWGTWMCPSGKLLSLHDVTELSQTWCVCCVCAGGDGRASDVKISLYREMFLLCPTPGVWEPFLWHVLSSAMPCSGHCWWCKCSLGFSWALVLLSKIKCRPWL